MTPLRLLCILVYFPTCKIALRWTLRSSKHNVAALSPLFRRLGKRAAEVHQIQAFWWGLGDFEPPTGRVTPPGPAFP